MRKFFFFAALSIASLFAANNSADAGFQVTFRAGASSLTIVDGDGNDSDATVNTITVLSKIVGAYTFNVTLTATNSPGGAVAFVEHGTNNITGIGATTIEIVASANNFNAPVGLLTATSGSTFQFLSGSSSGTAAHSYAAYYDGSNTLATSTPAGTLIGSGSGSASTPLGNSDLSDVKNFTAVADYALTLSLKAVLTGTGTNRIDLDGAMEVAPVPVPAGLVLAVTAFPALGLGAFLRRRKSVVA